YEFIGVLAANGETGGLPVLGRLADLEEMLAEHRPDEPTVGRAGLREEQLLDLVGEAHRRGLKVRVAPTTAELRTRRAVSVAALGGSDEASGPLFQIKAAPRVTAVGVFLRRYSLDDLPQVLNVLRGEMSLVGPRPLPLRDYVQLEDWHRKRYLVLPGMTGLWQVSGRIELTFDDLVRLDFYYLENWSIWLDISILTKTLPAVLARRGAY